MNRLVMGDKSKLQWGVFFIQALLNIMTIEPARHIGAETNINLVVIGAV